MEPLLARLRGSAALDGRAGEIPEDVCEQATARLRQLYDKEHGGFGGAPKFPSPSAIEFLLGQLTSARCRCTRCGRWPTAASTTRSAAASRATRSMPAGSSRTSRRCSTTTRCWRGRTCTAGSARVTSCSSACARRRSTSCCASCGRTKAAFASALDADSEGVEGKFYVWRRDEVSDEAARVFGITAAGNWEGTNIPVRATSDPPNLAELKAELLAQREQRVRPGLDDKRLTSWNALAVSAFADAGAALGRADYVDAARVHRRLPAHRDARRRGPPAAHLQPRRGPPAGLPGGPRQPRRGAAHPVRGDLRGPLVHGCARPRRRDDLPLRRPRARRLLLHRARPRAARRPPPRPRGQPDAVRPVRGGSRTAAPRRAHRGGRLRRAGPLGAAAAGSSR